MPEKDGADDKKKMKNEEVVDYLKDTGRYKRSPDTKDATSYPPSEEVKKTQKVNTGPSAFELIKKKYKGQIMDVGKKKANEELDSTKVAESFGGCIVEVIGPKPNVSDQYTKTMRKNVKKGEKILDKLKSFNDPEADKQRTDAENDPDLEKIGQQETGKKEPKKFFDPVKAKEKRDAFIAGRKAYTDSKSGIKKGEPTEKGIIDYITKARDMRQGTNANTKANREAAKVIAKSSGKEYAQKIRDKYETDKDMSRRRGKNQPTEQEVKADIDKQNPTYPSPIKTMGVKGDMKNRPLPFSTRRTNTKSFTDKVLDDIERVRQAGPEKQKEIEDKLRAIPDDPRIRVGKTSGDIIKTDPKTGKETEITPSGRVKPIGTLGRRAEKAQQSTLGALGGFLAKSAVPATAGLEAAERLRKGEKGVALSAIQARDIPVLSKAAGIMNAIQTVRRGQQAAANQQAMVDAATGGGGGGGKKPPATSGGRKKDGGGGGGGLAAVGGDAPETDTVTSRILATQLPNIGKRLRQGAGSVPRGLRGGTVGRRSAGGFTAT